MCVATFIHFCHEKYNYVLVCNPQHVSATWEVLLTMETVLRKQMARINLVTATARPMLWGNSVTCVFQDTSISPQKTQMAAKVCKKHLIAAWNVLI